MNSKIVLLVKELEAEGVLTSVVVGNDRIKKIESYAGKFPFPILSDPRGRFYDLAGFKGVPAFVVTNDDGEILNQYFGGYFLVKDMRDVLEI